MRWIRIALTLCAGTISLLLVCQHFELITMPCNRYCGAIRDWPLSKLVAVLALAGVVALGKAAWLNQDAVFRRWSILGAVVAICMQGVALALNGACQSCIALAFLLVGLGLTNIKKLGLGYLGLLVGTVGVYVLLADKIAMAQAPGPTPLLLRPYERPIDPRAHIYVVVADLECPACRQLSRIEAQNKRFDVVIVYRWYLQPASSARTGRAALVIEGISEQDWAKGATLRRSLFASQEPLTDQTILRVADSLGMRGEAESLLQIAPDRLLYWIAEDGKTFTSLGVSEVPYVFDTPGKRRILGHSSTQVIESFAQPTS